MEQGQPPRRRQKGGLITMPFILANEALEKVASYGLLPNMILYLMGDYHVGITQGTNILFFWSAATNFSPLVGAFISDSYLGRFLTIGLGSIFSLLSAARGGLQRNPVIHIERVQFRSFGIGLAGCFPGVYVIFLEPSARVI